MMDMLQSSTLIVLSYSQGSQPDRSPKDTWIEENVLIELASGTHSARENFIRKEKAKETRNKWQKKGHSKVN